MSGLINLSYFLDVFPKVEDPNVSGITVSIYEIGCLLGAIGAIFIGDKLGRKNTILLGMVVMCIGTVIMTSSYSLGQFIVGRIVCGVGNGFNTATVPSLQSELAPPAIRGSLVLISGTLIAVGIAVAYWIGLGAYFVQSSFSWRFPIAFQIVFALLTVVLLFGIPESPGWLIKHGHIEEGRVNLAKIYRLDPNDPEIDGMIDAAQATNAEASAFKFRDLFTNGPTQNFRRASLAFVSQVFQQVTGINLVSYYASYLFINTLGLSQLMGRIMGAVLSTEYALAAAVCVTFVDRLGRRPTMIWGAFGCGLAFVAACVLVYYSDKGNRGAAWGAVAMYFVYNTSFAFGWLGQTWLYPAELTSIEIRSQVNGLSTCANWLFNFCVVEITPPGFANIGNYLYLVFAIINLFVIVPGVYFFFVETSGRSLEEISLVFAEAYSDPALGGYVKHSKHRPHVTGKQLDAELATALRAGKLRQRNGGAIEHVENVHEDKRGAMRRLDSEKGAGLQATNSGSSNESATARGSVHKESTARVMPPRNTSTIKLSLDTSPLALPALLKLLTSSPHLDMSKAIQLASKLIPAGYTSHFKLRTITGVDLARIGVADEDLRKSLLTALGRGDKGKGKGPSKPEFGDEGMSRRKRGRESDLDKPLPSKHDKVSEVEQDLDFDEIDYEEGLGHKMVVVNRAPVMTAWATVVGERLGFSRQEALSIAHVFTNLNATSKAVSIGLKPESELKDEIGSSQPFVELMGRKVPVLSTHDSGWRAISNGVVAEPSKAFAYVQSAFRQQMGAVIGAMRLLANSFEPNELNDKGYGLYLDFRPDSDGWGKKAEMRMITILDLRRFLTHTANPVKEEEFKHEDAEPEEPERKRVKVEDDVKPTILEQDDVKPEIQDEFDALLDDDDAIDFSAIEGV
ncbi:sugar porter family MFS transporter [Sporobolomyces koalae]|uniref:sugar porter family MFS transporter n=1 Tax=Sporobolomyces koalae TaxID=500713 RepID=UPI00317A23ED